MQGFELADKYNAIIGRIVEGYRPDKILVFGSHARGEAGPDSDVDILIIKKTSERPVERRSQVLQLLKGCGVPKDIFVLNPEEFDQRKVMVGTIAYEAHNFGKVVYESIE